MSKINYISELKSSIVLLEKKQAEEAVLLKAQFNQTYDSLKPINLAKKFLKELTTPSDLKKDLLNATISIGAGYLSKKAAVGSTHNPIKQIVGTIIQMGVTSIVSKNTDGIKSVAKNFLSKILIKKKISA